ncbi:MAG TPA: STAS domain-containing protein [Marmoricola sp.]|nr:STAS domain-containing protein [Marmoricola sp.]
MELHIDARRSATRTVIAPRGEIDMANEPFFNEVLDTFLRDGPVDALVDLTEVSFMDSTGLRALLRARELSVGRGGSFALVCPPGRVWRLLDLAGVLELFTIHAVAPEDTEPGEDGLDASAILGEPPLEPA